MSVLARRQHRAVSNVASFSLAVILGSLLIGCAGDPASAPASAGDPGAVQERAVSRAQLGVLSPLPPQTAAVSDSRGSSSALQSTDEPDYKYPWVVQIGTCAGVVIRADWVLTAAHCVADGLPKAPISYRRIDAYGTVQTQTSEVFQGFPGNPMPGVFIHPEYQPMKGDAYDIALVWVEALSINLTLQTAGLPLVPKSPGLVGTAASYKRPSGATTPPGYVAIFRGPISTLASPTKVIVSANTVVNAAPCPGQGGAGFITVENGRATVRGVASKASVGNCRTASGGAEFTDVFAVRKWIFQTIGTSHVSLFGDTRVRWSGDTARGKMSVYCPVFGRPDLGYRIDSAPLNVVGVELSTHCGSHRTQTAICELDANQPSTAFGPPQIIGFTKRTFSSRTNDSVVQSLPFSANLAKYSSSYPLSEGYEEFTCRIGNRLTGTTGPIGGTTGGGVRSRGVEGEPQEETVEQPSPFYGPEYQKLLDELK